MLEQDVLMLFASVLALKKKVCELEAEAKRQREFIGAVIFQEGEIRLKTVTLYRFQPSEWAMVETREDFGRFHVFTLVKV